MTVEVHDSCWDLVVGSEDNLDQLLEKKVKLKNGVIIFTRDLRLEDNYNISLAKNFCTTIYPIFIFRDKQILEEKNPYFNNFAIKFMCESLEDLFENANGNFTFFEAKNDSTVLTKIEDKIGGIDALFISHDYTNYSICQRKKDIVSWTKKNDSMLFMTHNHLLAYPYFVSTGDDTTMKSYKVFTPFWKAFVKKYDVSDFSVKTGNLKNFRKVKGKIKEKISLNDIHNYYEIPELPKDLEDLEDLIIPGGRSFAMKKLKNAKKWYKNYGKTRDYPAIEKNTTKLSAYNKFGCISPREAWTIFTKAFGNKKTNDINREYCFREFYYCAFVDFPQLRKGGSYKNEEYKKMNWGNNKKWFKKWCNGETGYPFVDAGMRELKYTGFMENRLRMVTTNFLVKDLHIDWKWGEKHFAKYLRDYDPVMNACGHDWSSGFGLDGQPYFRIFNPWTQSKKFDKDGEYITKFIPELEGYEKNFHSYEKMMELTEKDGELYKIYPPPLVNHADERTKTLKEYKKIF